MGLRSGRPSLLLSSCDPSTSRSVSLALWQCQERRGVKVPESHCSVHQIVIQPRGLRTMRRSKARGGSASGIMPALPYNGLPAWAFQFRATSEAPRTDLFLCHLAKPREFLTSRLESSFCYGTHIFWPVFLVLGFSMTWIQSM